MLKKTIVAVILLIADQITKLLIVSNMQPFDTIPIWSGVLHITYVQNTGAAFGMMDEFRWILIGVTVIVIPVLIYIIKKYGGKSKMLDWSLFLILAGALGNFIDRLRLGFVIDFVDFRAINFYIFNVADSCIVIGGILLVIYTFLSSKNEKNDPVLEDGKES